VRLPYSPLRRIEASSLILRPRTFAPHVAVSPTRHLQSRTTIPTCLFDLTGLWPAKVRATSIPSFHSRLTTNSGFTFDTILGLIRKTILNPTLTLPLFLYSLYSPKGKEYALQNPIFSKWLRRFAIASAVRKVSNLLDQGMMNNWKNDSYDWKKEIIVVTGGSDGIGSKIVQLFAEMGITVVVLDIQPPKYTSTSLLFCRITFLTPTSRTKHSLF